MRYLLGQAASAADSAFEKLFDRGVLGVICVLLCLALAWAVRRWNEANEARVKEGKEMAQTVIALTNSFRDAVRDMTTTIQELKTSTVEEKAVLTKLEATIDSVMRDAVRHGDYRRHSPSAGLPAQKP